MDGGSCLSPVGTINNRRAKLIFGKVVFVTSDLYRMDHVP